MSIHLIAEPRVSVGVEADHSIEIDGGSVRENNAVPGNLDAVLPIRHSRIVLAGQPGALRNQQVHPGRGIVHIRRDESLQFAWKIGIQRLFQNCRDFPSSFDLKT